MMGVGNSRKVRRRQERNYKRTRVTRGGRTVFTHSHMGAWSCYFAIASLVVFAAAVLVAFLLGTKGVRFTGGLGAVAVLLAFGGIRAAMDGFRERDKNYVNCKVGIAVNIVILLFLIVVFVIGCLY